MKLLAATADPRRPRKPAQESIVDFDSIVDPDTSPGNVTAALARLLIDLARRRRQRPQLLAQQ